MDGAVPVPTCACIPGTVIAIVISHILSSPLVAHCAMGQKSLCHSPVASHAPEITFATASARYSTPMLSELNTSLKLIFEDDSVRCKELWQ